jgi:hypothetical protein
MSEFWDVEAKNENQTGVTPDKLDSYVKSPIFKTVLETEYKTTIQPTVYGCSVSYDMGGSYNGTSTPWSWGYTSYDNGGYHDGSRRQIVIPTGLGGLYLILSDVSITPLVGPGAATQLDMNIVVVTSNAITNPSGTSTRSFGTGLVAGPLDWSSNKFLLLDEGDAIYISGGGIDGSLSPPVGGNWTCPLFDNHLSVIRFPFGS